MSLVNFSITPHRALIAVDTLGGTAQQQLHISKLFTLPHANMVLCGRGNFGFLARAAARCALISGLDEAKAVLPAELQSILRQQMALAICALAPKATILGAQEVYLFGWSDAAGEMAVLKFSVAASPTKWLGRLCTRATITLDEDLEAGVAPVPWGPDGVFPDLHDSNVMMLVAKQQVWHCQRNHPGEPIGGRLIFAQLTRTALQIESLGDIFNSAPSAITQPACTALNTLPEPQ